MNVLTYQTSYWLAVGLSVFTSGWLLVASFYFICQNYKKAQAAAIIGAVALAFLVVVMWDAHNRKPIEFPPLKSLSH